MASGGSYVIDDTGQRVLKQRSGHNTQPQPPAAPANKKVTTDEDKKESAAGRG